MFLSSFKMAHSKGRPDYYQHKYNLRRKSDRVSIILFLLYEKNIKKRPANNVNVI